MKHAPYLFMMIEFNSNADRFFIILYVLASIITVLHLFCLSTFLSLFIIYILSLLIFLTYSLSLYIYYYYIYSYKSYVLYTILLFLSLLYYSTIVLLYYTMSATVAAPTNVCSYCNRQCVYGS